jgi:hypothetical protein
MASVKVELQGLKELEAQLRTLPLVVRRVFSEGAYRTAQLVVLRAAAKAPVRRHPRRWYTGGMLKQALTAVKDTRTGGARLGLDRRLIVINASGRIAAVNRARKSQWFTKTGKKRTDRVYLRKGEREKVRIAGGLIIQPAKYGHFTEYGRGGRGRGARFAPWLAPAVAQSTDYLAREMKLAAEDVAGELSKLGRKPGG